MYGVHIREQAPPEGEEATLSAVWRCTRWRRLQVLDHYVIPH